MAVGETQSHVAGGGKTEQAIGPMVYCQDGFF
jgi:hypothetical protein